MSNTIDDMISEASEKMLQDFSRPQNKVIVLSSEQIRRLESGESEMELSLGGVAGAYVGLVTKEMLHDSEKPKNLGAKYDCKD